MRRLITTAIGPWAAGLCAAIALLAAPAIAQVDMMGTVTLDMSLPFLDISGAFGVGADDNPGPADIQYDPADGGAFLTVPDALVHFLGETYTPGELPAMTVPTTDHAEALYAPHSIIAAGRLVMAGDAFAVYGGSDEMFYAALVVTAVNPGVSITLEWKRDFVPSFAVSSGPYTGNEGPAPLELMATAPGDSA